MYFGLAFLTLHCFIEEKKIHNTDLHITLISLPDIRCPDSSVNVDGPGETLVE